MIVFAFLIGYIDDVTGPQTHYYENNIVVVDKKYQCPVDCEVYHNHSVYYVPESNGMIIDRDKLGKKHKEPKKKRRK
jgi:hypothetical protein